jgi:hypothetical protein
MNSVLDSSEEPSKDGPENQDTTQNTTGSEGQENPTISNVDLAPKKPTQKNPNTTKSTLSSAIKNPGQTGTTKSEAFNEIDEVKSIFVLIA